MSSDAKEPAGPEPGKQTPPVRPAEPAPVESAAAKTPGAQPVAGKPPAAEPPPVKPAGPRPADAKGTAAGSAAVARAPTEPSGRVSNPTVPLPPTVTAIYGLVRQRSQYSVAETTRRLTALVQARGQQVFGDIDFAGDAGRAGLSMRPMRQLVFGHPRAGTPLILAAPTVALDLPLRVLIFEDGNGVVWIAYNDAEYLRERHQLPDGLLANIGVLPDLVARAVGTERVEGGG